MRLALLLVFGLLVQGLGAQTASLSGKITDAASQQPLPGANIIAGAGRGTVADLQGNFQLNLPAGNYRIQFQFVGYRSVKKDVTLEPGQTLVLNVALEADITQIGQVVVSASRVEQRIAETTVSMAVIRPRDFQAAQIQDPRELINKTPGIEVLDGQASIRGGSGFSYGAGSRVLTLVDGLPVLASDAGNIRWQFLPLENLSQIEIIKGASSVLYGSSALNGVINFRTAHAEETARNTFFAESGVYDRPANESWKWWSNPRWMQSTSFSHLKRYGNTEVALGTFLMKNDGYRRLNHENLGRFNLNVRHHHTTVAGLSYGLNTNVGYVDKRDFVLWEDAQTGALRQAESTSINLRGTFLTLDPFVRYRRSLRTAHDLRVRLQHTGNQFPDGANNNSAAVSLYAEYLNNFVLSDRVSFNSGLVQHSSFIRSQFYGDHQALNLAAYLQADISLSAALKLVGGLRLEHNTLNGEPDRMVTLFRAGANYQAGDFTFLRASFGQGYRYPAIAEKFASTTLGAVRIFPNIFLQPESGWNSELAIRQGIALGPWEGMMDMALFYTQNKDLIEFMFGLYPDPVTDEFGFGFRATNTEYSRVYGVEWEFGLTRKTRHWEHTLRGGYVYMYPVEFDPRTGNNTGQLLKYRRKHAGKLSLATQYGLWRMGVDLFARSRILNIDDVFLDELTREEILPGFYDYWQNQQTGHLVIDGVVARRISSVWTLSGAIKNLGNTEYMGRPGDIMPHRSFHLRLQAAF